MSPTDRKPRWSRIGTFLLITFLIDWVFVFGLDAGGVTVSGMLGWVVGSTYMIVPAAVAVALALKWGVPLRRYGLRMPRWKLIAIASLAPIVIVGLTVVAALAMGFGQFDPTGAAVIEHLRRMGMPQVAEQMARQLEQMPIHPVLLAVLSAIPAGLTINGIFALGEELGWRGLLQRELAPLGFARSSALIGLIWGIWHAPLILGGHNYPEHPRLGVLVMTLACVPLGIILSWIALRVNSVIAPAIAHGTFNALAGVPLMSIRGGDQIEIGVLGYAAIIVMAAIAAVLLRMPPDGDTYATWVEDRRSDLPPAPQEETQESPSTTSRQAGAEPPDDEHSPPTAATAQSRRRLNDVGANDNGGCEDD